MATHLRRSVQAELEHLKQYQKKYYKVRKQTTAQRKEIKRLERLIACYEVDIDINIINKRRRKLELREVTEKQLLANAYRISR